MDTAFLIGDSQTKYLQDKLNPSFSLFWKSGMRVEEVPMKQLQRTRTVPNVVIHLGTNNLGRNKAEETFKYFCALVQCIRNENARCTIFVSGMYVCV